MEDNLKDTFIEMVTTRVIVQIYDGDEKEKLLTHEDFKLKIHEGMPYLTLGDIEEQLKRKYPKESMLIDVWYELGLSGRIYRYTDENSWVEHGTTRGYA